MAMAMARITIRTNRMTPTKATPKLHSKRLEVIIIIKKNITIIIRATRNRKVKSRKITRLSKEDSNRTTVKIIVVIILSKLLNKNHSSSVERDNSIRTTTTIIMVAAVITKNLQIKEKIEEIITKIALLLQLIMPTKQTPTKRPSKLQVLH